MKKKYWQNQLKVRLHFNVFCQFLTKLFHLQLLTVMIEKVFVFLILLFFYQTSFFVNFLPQNKKQALTIFLWIKKTAASIDLFLFNVFFCHITHCTRCNWQFVKQPIYFLFTYHFLIFFICGISRFLILKCFTNFDDKFW